MAETVIIHGNTYASVPQVEIPRAQGSGNAVFYDTSGDTMAASDLLSGKTGHGPNGAVTGSMTEHGAVTQYIANTQQPVTLSAGHISSLTVDIKQSEKEKITSGNIRANVTILGVSGAASVVDTTISTNAATAADIASGKKAVVNGVTLTGTATQPTITQDSTTKVLTIS